MPTELFPYLRLFGSRKWGGYTCSSDYDYLAKLDDYDVIIDIIEKYFPTDSIIKTIAYSIYENFKITHNKHTYQIILLDDEDYRVQSAVCDILDNYYKNNKSIVKRFRIHNYEFLKCLITHGSKTFNTVSLPKIQSFVSNNYPELLL